MYLCGGQLPLVPEQDQGLHKPLAQSRVHDCIVGVQQVHHFTGEAFCLLGVAIADLQK